GAARRPPPPRPAGSGLVLRHRAESRYDEETVDEFRREGGSRARQIGRLDDIGPQADLLRSRLEGGVLLHVTQLFELGPEAQDRVELRSQPRQLGGLDGQLREPRDVLDVLAADAHAPSPQSRSRPARPTSSCLSPTSASSNNTLTLRSFPTPESPCTVPL